MQSYGKVVGRARIENLEAVQLSITVAASYIVSWVYETLYLRIWWEETQGQKATGKPLVNTCGYGPLEKDMFLEKRWFLTVSDCCWFY